MGSFASKLFYSCEQDDSCQENQETCSTPLKYTTTPPLKRKILVDPRSATVGLPRTPIDVNKMVTPTTEKTKMPTCSAIPKRLQLRPYLETNFDETIAVSSVNNLLDPRSPNVPLPRTPIVLPTKSEHSNSKDKSDPESIFEDPRSPTMLFDRTPILKPKSPVNEHRSSESQLLFCETLTDENIPEIQALPEIRQDAAISRQSFVEKLAQAKAEDDDPEEMDKIEELPLSTQKIIDNILMSTVQKIEAEEKIQIYEDSQTKKLEEEKETETKVEEDMKCEKVQTKEVVIEVEHDKSGDVILEDTKMKKETKKSFGQESANFNSNRKTPLGIRSTNHNQIQSQKKPKVQKTNPHPTIKSKAIFANDQQENTPPGKKTKSRLNTTQWDPDNTIVI